MQLVRTLMPALLGNALEFYDYACFSSLTTELTKALFPDDDYGRQREHSEPLIAPLRPLRPAPRAGCAPRASQPGGQ